MHIEPNPISQMTCEHCGAPLKLEAERHYFFCEYCSALYFPKESPEGLKVLGAASTLPCPICHIPLVLAKIGNFEVLACKQCKGLLLDMVDFLPVLDYLRLKYPTRQRPPERFNSKELNRELNCPHCGNKMETYPYGGPGNVVLDNCIESGILWLDYDEINRIVQTPERMNNHGIPWLDITSLDIDKEEK